MMHMEKRVFSLVYIIGSLLSFISCILTIVAFASPYWAESDPSKNTKFSNIGLWQVCFHRYRHLQSDSKITYIGCYWIWSNEVINMRNWLIPPWFYTVQIFVSSQLIFNLLILVLLSISFLTFLRNKFFFVLVITIFTMITSLLMLCGLLVFGINVYNKEWMPSPEDNYCSWAYWCQAATSFCCLISTSFLLSELRSLYKPMINVKKRAPNRVFQSEGSDYEDYDNYRKFTIHTEI